MNKELNIGDYVRTEDGIKKIVKYDYDERIENGHALWFENEKYGVLYTDEEIKELKPSPNIIDLIKVGDYVNGKEVLEIKKVGDFNGARVFGDVYFNEDIKSIVTKEMYESMEYKVDKQ